MHEWALAEGVAATVSKVAGEQNLKKITKITINLGQLQQIEKKIFKFALKETMQFYQKLFNKIKIQVNEEKAVFKCRVCGREWTFADSAGNLNPATSEAIHFIPETAHAYMGCPACKSPDFEIVHGRGVWIESITGESFD